MSNCEIDVVALFRRNITSPKSSGNSHLLAGELAGRALPMTGAKPKDEHSDNLLCHAGMSLS